MAIASTALATLDKNEVSLAQADHTFYLPENFKDALDLCNFIADSSLVPKSMIKKPADIFVAAKFGQSLGLSVLQSVYAIAVINGRPGIFGDDMLAVVQAHPAYEGHKEYMEGEGDKRKAVFIIKRRGQEPHTSEFSVAEAKTAGLWDDRAMIERREGGGQMRNPAPWHTYPERMLKMRARAFGLRDKFADALRGMKCIEELNDYPVTIEATAWPTSTNSPTDPPPAQSNGNAKKSPEPESDACISAEQANELGKALKASGYNVKESREYFKRTLGVDTSLQIKVSQYEDAMKFAKTPKAQVASDPPSAGNGQQAPATEEKYTGPYAQQFDLLGWTPLQCSDYLASMSKFSEGQIKADLNRRLEEQDSKQ